MAFTYFGHYVTNEQANKIWDVDETIFTTPTYFGNGESIINDDRVPEGYTELFTTQRGTMARIVTYAAKAIRIEDGRVVLFVHVHGATNDNESTYATRAIGVKLDIDSAISFPTTSQFTNGVYGGNTTQGIACYGSTSSNNATNQNLGWSVTSRNYAWYYWNVLHVFVGESEHDTLAVTFNSFHNNPSGTFMNAPIIINTSVDVPSLIAKAKVKVDGAWEDCEMYVKVNGAWKEVKDLYVKENGAWKLTS